ncbi:MAG: nitroreductase family protein [Luteibaculum sp.]
MIVSDSKKEKFIPHNLSDYTSEEVLENAKRFRKEMATRRSMRQFSDKPVPREVIEEILRVANNAPSGANKQPWTYCVISNPEIKQEIRRRAEEEEYLSYNGRMSKEWLKDVEPFGTNHIKEFIEKAPYIIVVFKKVYDQDEYNQRKSNYYVNESVGISVGFLISAIHQAGLACLTHTPSPMNFLHEVLERPENERPFLLLPVGYPAEGAKVPAIEKKSLEELSVFYE